MAISDIQIFQSTAEQFVVIIDEISLSHLFTSCLDKFILFHCMLDVS